LARVEYTSETARQRVVEELGIQLKELGIRFQEIMVVCDARPGEVVSILLDILSELPSGVVSISGLGALFVNRDSDWQEFLYLLNFNRENFARLPLRQIWWLPVHVADLFVRTIPDFDSWFLQKMKLTETMTLQEPCGEFVLWEPRGSVSVEDARNRAAFLVKRFDEGISRHEEPNQLLEGVAVPAVDVLLEAGLRWEAFNLYNGFETKLGAQGLSQYPYLKLKETLWTKSLAESEAHLGPNHPIIAGIVRGYAGFLKDLARFPEAERLIRRALSIDEASYGPEHPTVAMDLNNLAFLLQATNRLTEAEPLMLRALAIDEAAYGAEHPNIARDLNNLARLYQATNRLTEAEPLLRRALAVSEAAYGPDHPTLAIGINNLALLLHATSRLAAAEPLMRRALAITEAAYGPEHPTVAIRLNNLATLLQATNRLEEAGPLMRRAMAILVTSLGSEHPHTRLVQENLATLEADISKNTVQP
jgi:tetratricopeptide (TPR) repeat protein